MALRQGFLTVLLFSPVIIFPPMLHILLLVAMSRTMGEAWEPYLLLRKFGECWVESTVTFYGSGG